MGRYFFDIVADGELTSDEEGMILPNMTSVRHEASRSLADLARDTLRRQGCQRLAISVRTDDGPVYEARFQWGLQAKH
jgi:uncharacterized protein DUF6894